MRSELLLERLALLVWKAIYFLLPWRRVVNPVRPSLGDTSTLSSPSEKGDDTAQLSAVFETDDTEDRIASTRKAPGVVSSGRSATELVVPGKGAKAKSFQEEEKVLQGGG